MKNIFIVAFALLTLMACEVNNNTSKESSLKKYMKLDEDGLKCNDIYIEIGDEKVDRKEFSYGEEVFFCFNDITGFEKVNDKAFPGLAVEITNVNTNEIVLENDDLFADTDGFSLKVLLLYSNVTMALPYRNDESYNIKINIWDKKSDKSLAFEMPFIIKESDEFTIRTKDVTYSAIYLWNGDKDKFVANDDINPRDQLLLIFEGVDGFESIGGVVYPELSLSLIDNNGESIIEKENLFSSYATSGMDAEQFKKQVYIDIEFYEDRYSNPLVLESILTDSKSDCKLSFNTEIEVH